MNRAVLAHLAGCPSSKGTAERRPATATDGCFWTEGVGGASVKATNQREEMRRKTLASSSELHLVVVVLLLLLFILLTPVDLIIY